MRLVSFSCDGRSSYGVLKDGGIVDAGARLPVYATLRDAIRADDLGTIASLADAKGPDVSLADIRFEPTITNPQKVICIGVNYGNRNAEYKDDSQAPKYPSVFMRSRESLTGHLEPLLRPPESEQLDYEGEIAIVVGKEGHRIPLENARDHIAGLTLMNEGSIRDWLRHAKFNVTQGKNFLKSGSLGPWLATVDEFERFDKFQLTTRVNGELRQNDNTENLMFDFPYLLNYLSTFFTLMPGDIITTGTPIGAGARFDPPIYLKPGDSVVIEVPEIGRLENGIADDILID